MTNTKIIAVANQKSGVEKSATVFNLGAGLDMDSKFALSYLQGYHKEKPPKRNWTAFFIPR